MYGRRLAHRLMYEMVHGPIPEGAWVCHHCDNPGCCNPRHLFLSTAQGNAMDMVQKGRGVDNRGSRNGQAKLTEEEVLSIRQLHAQGSHSMRNLAAQYGVAYSHIRNLIARRRWGWLEQESA